MNMELVNQVLGQSVEDYRKFKGVDKMDCDIVVCGEVRKYYYKRTLFMTAKGFIKDDNFILNIDEHWNDSTELLQLIM